MIKREKYLKKINDNLWDISTILFLIWARQVWKTTLLESLFYFKYIKKKESLFLFWDELINFWINNYESLFSYIKNKTDIKKIKYLIIDEAQALENIWLSLKIFIDKIRRWEFAFKIIVSGSWSLNIFKWMTDTLTWRKTIIKIYPFNFEEFLIAKWEKFEFWTEEWRLKIYLNYFKEYILFGWYPKIVLTESPEKKWKLFISLLNDYIFRDVILLLKEKEIIKFREFLKIISSKVWTTINITSLIEELWISRKIVEKYLFVVENTFLLEKIDGFIWWKITKEVKKKFKIYFNDIWMLRYLIWINEWVWDLKWKVIENFVFNEINSSKKDWQEIYFWQTRNLSEVDFIIENKINFKLIPIEVKSWNRDIFTKSYNNFTENYKENIEYWIITSESVFKKREKKDVKIYFLPYLMISFLNNITKLEKND